MKLINLLFFPFVIFVFIIIFSFQEQSNEILILDDNTYIHPIVDNRGTSDEYVRTLKLKYRDFNKRVLRSDSSYYRCAFETEMVFYSAFDTLALQSLSHKSCDIIAFFNLKSSDVSWLKNNSVFYIRITNKNTKYTQILDNQESHYFNNLKY